MRPSRDQYFLEMVNLISRRSTCYRRSVGCVLVNTRGHVLATGYNGVASGMPHCNEPTSYYRDGTSKEMGNFCSGAKSPSGQNLDGCNAIHAEANALLQCRDVYDIHHCYVSVFPCIHCTKLLLNTSCLRIVSWKPYANSGRALWEQAGREYLTIES